MYYIAICDDDLNFADYIEKILIKRVGLKEDEAIFFKYSSGEDLIKSFSKAIPFNLLILDMQLKKLDGDATAREFRKRYPDTLLAFCSGVCLPTVKSFEANAYRYLIKEYDSDRMATELKNIVAEMKRRKESPNILLSYRTEKLFVDSSQILYVSKRKHGCNVYLYDKENKKTKHFVCSKSINDLADEIGEFGFASPHSSYFINLSYVTSIINKEVRLVDGTILTISRSREKSFKGELAFYLAKKY